MRRQFIKASHYLFLFFNHYLFQFNGKSLPFNETDFVHLTAYHLSNSIDPTTYDLFTTYMPVKMDLTELKVRCQRVVNQPSNFSSLLIETFYNSIKEMSGKVLAQ